MIVNILSNKLFRLLICLYMKYNIIKRTAISKINNILYIYYLILKYSKLNTNKNILFI